MNLKGLIGIGAIVLSSCTAGINMKTVDYDYLFNNDNSKVWIVNKMLKDNYVVSSHRTFDKHLLIFHDDGECDYIAMRDLTDEKPLTGDYYVDSEAKELSIDFGENALWHFDLAYLDEDSILMVPTEKSSMEFSIQLKPFPKL